MNKLKENLNKAVALIRVVLYLRLSDEDRNKLTKEQISESIKNQEIMLREYANEQGWQIVGIYNDEDWSGGDNTRPNFNKMIKECENGNVDVVLCKTQARFARDAELIEKYLHNKFHEWKVRFITLVDKIDNTKRETKKTSQILGLTDQWYIEDTSLNIRETFKAKRKNGELTASFSTYGYLKDPENKNHLVIDPVASVIVKRIFDEYMSGYGVRTIAERLNADKILSPLEYKKLNGVKLHNPFVKNLMDLECINRTGTYMITINFNNNSNQILNNLISFNYLTTDMKTFNNKCEITLKKYSSNKTKLYYSTKENLDTNNFNVDDFVLLNENDTLPDNTTCIVSLTETLDRTHNIDYQFEITLKENVKKDKFYFNVEHIVDNNDLNVDLDFNVNIRKKLMWSAQTIKTILQNEVYIGNLIQGKTTTVNYKNKTVIHVPEDEQPRKDNTHEPIIDKVIFFTIQERLQEVARSCKSGEMNAFSRRVYCQNCGKIFRKCGKNNPDGYGYFCCKDKEIKWVNCDNRKYLSEKELNEFVLEKINTLLQRFYSQDNLNELKDNMVEKDLFQEKIKALEKELDSIEKELENKSSYFQRLYEDRLNGILPEKEFLILMNKYKDDIEKFEERKKLIIKEISITNQKKETLKSKKNIFKKYEHIRKLNVEIVGDFIDKILVGKYDEESNTREINIIWNFTI